MFLYLGIRKILHACLLQYPSIPGLISYQKTITIRLAKAKIKSFKKSYETELKEKLCSKRDTNLMR